MGERPTEEAVASAPLADAPEPLADAPEPLPAAPGPLPDAPARARIVAERERNVSIVAGAGTGKTTAIVRRMVEMLAPEDDAQPAIAISRLVAITFTRRAAGELRFRVRGALLAELARPALSRPRAARLRAALAGLDVAFVGTIHGFADRLLRRRPTEANLSPAYELVEDAQPLVAEALRRLLRGVERDQLAEALGAWGAALTPAQLAAAQQAVRAAQRAGIAMERHPSSWGELPSLEGLVNGFIESRDAPPAVPAPAEADLESLRQVGDQVRRELDGLPAISGEERSGRRWLGQVAERLRGIDGDQAAAVGVVQEILARRMWPRNFGDDHAAYGLYRRLVDPRGPLYPRLIGPHRWLGAQLVQVAPVAVALYEQVRSERQVIDFIDVLVRLRALLRDRLDVRRELQGLFDHILVDEFQDTDALQCEIVFYLCDAGQARRWEDIRLTPGRLTLVGDPQQSIYRFRRADIAMYIEAMGRLTADGALEERLTTNFRSRPSLVRWFNAAMPSLLGAADGRHAWSARDGRVPFQPLDPSPEIDEFEPSQSVLVLHYVGAGQTPLRPYAGRAVEASALALLLQNLIRPDSRMRIRDEETGALRSIRPADVAVLTESMTAVPLLLEALNALGIRSTVRGGRLLLDHPLIREMLLGYCALCDPLDGVAQAALMRTPFFPLKETAGLDPDEMGWQIAVETVEALRRRRAACSPGALIRDLVERTGLRQALLLEVNGVELLSACYDVALELDRRALAQQLDAGAAASLARAWATSPIPLIAPEPTGHDAIRVLTVFQAKGLEFPVVVLWDGFRSLTYDYDPDWLTSRDGAQWAMRLGDVVFEHPQGCGLLAAERRIRSRERERMAYVAATRARDLLILPVPERDWGKRERNPTLAAAGEVSRLPFVEGELPKWHRAADSEGLPEPIPDADLELDLLADALHEGAALTAAEEDTRVFSMARAAAALALQVSPESAWAGVRQLDLDEDDLEDDEADLFSAAVHAALGLFLTDRASDPAEASERATRAYEIPHLVRGVATHVQRSLATLIEMGFHPGADLLRCALPITLPEAPHNRLLAGTIDLLVQTGEVLWIIDLRADPPPARGGRLSLSHPEVIVALDFAQQALQAAHAVDDLKIRRAVLFTRTGELIEV